jgi:lysozyme
MIRGIDVSNHQGQINWNAVPASGIQFAIAKASEGVTFIDRWFGRNWTEMKRIGLVRGAYHYALPSRNDPIQEADFFLSRVDNPEVATLEPGDLVALDMEDPDMHSSVTLWSLRWLRRVEERLGFKPLFYTYPHYMDTHGLHDARLAQYGLWYASYRADMPDPPAPWPMIAIWQYTSEAVIPGAGTRIDANWFNGDTLDQLRAYGKPGATPPPPDPPSTDALLEAEYQRIGAAVLGEKVAKAFLDWEVDWTHFHADVLLCAQGVVSVDPPSTRDAQRLFIDAATGYLEGAGKLTRS